MRGLALAVRKRLWLELFSFRFYPHLPLPSDKSADRLKKQKQKVQSNELKRVSFKMKHIVLGWHLKAAP